MKTVIITGSTDGIGKQTALILAQKGFFVLIHGRNEEKCRQTVNEISSAIIQPLYSYRKLCRAVLLFLNR